MINAVSKYSFGTAEAYGIMPQASDKEQKTYSSQMQQPKQDTFVKKPKDHRNFWERNLAAIIGITSIGFLVVSIRNGRRARANEERFQKELEKRLLKNQENNNGKNFNLIQKFERTSSSPKNFDDVIGMAEEKKKLKRLIINPIKTQEPIESLPSGILLEGSPGNGKTFLVEALAGELNADLYKMNMSDLGSKYIHETGENIFRMISEVKEKAKNSKKPVILFLDELDGLARARNGNSGSNELEELNTILQNVNNLQEHNIILIGATNRKDLIDSAILRPGRFGEHILVNNPDEITRKAMVKNFLEKKSRAAELLKDETIMKEITQKLDGLSNAEIKHVIDNSSRLAIEEESATITKKNIEDAIKEFKESRRKSMHNPIGFKPNNN